MKTTATMPEVGAFVLDEKGGEYVECPRHKATGQVVPATTEDDPKATAVRVVNRAERRARDISKSTRERARDQRWMSLCMALAARVRPLADESLDEFVVRVRRIAKRVLRDEIRDSRRRVRAARRHRANQPQLRGPRFSIPNARRAA